MTETDARMRLHDAYDRIEEEFKQQLDESLDPSGPDSLFDYVAEMGLPAGAVAVDAGCGEGEYALELAARFGFAVTGVDLVPRLVAEARLSVPPGCPVDPHLLTWVHIAEPDSFPPRPCPLRRLSARLGRTRRLYQ